MRTPNILCHSSLMKSFFPFYLFHPIQPHHTHTHTPFTCHPVFAPPPLVFQVEVDVDVVVVSRHSTFICLSATECLCVVVVTTVCSFPSHSHSLFLSRTFIRLLACFKNSLSRQCYSRRDPVLLPQACTHMVSRFLSCCQKEDMSDVCVCMYVCMRCGDAHYSVI